ncbi:hypothetical protein D3C80_1890930 [compost metagenome]
MINAGLQRFVIGIIKGVPFENDLDKFAAKAPDLLNLLIGSRAWHKDLAFNA